MCTFPVIMYAFKDDILGRSWTMSIVKCNLKIWSFGLFFCSWQITQPNWSHYTTGTYLGFFYYSKYISSCVQCCHDDVFQPNWERNSSDVTTTGSATTQGNKSVTGQELRKYTRQLWVCMSTFIVSCAYISLISLNSLCYGFAMLNSGI